MPIPKEEGGNSRRFAGRAPRGHIPALEQRRDPPPRSGALIAAFWAVNLVGHVAERGDQRTRPGLDAAQLLADTLAALLFVWAQHDPHVGSETADWAVLVLPAIEGAIRFRVGGAVATWLLLAGGYAAANAHSTPSLPTATIAQRLTVVLLVALPVGYLAAISSPTSPRTRDTVADMGFADPHVFQLTAPIGDDTSVAVTRPVRGSSAASVGSLGESEVSAAVWPDATPPPGAPIESLELFAAQAGASLHNAQAHRRLEEFKDRLDHEASHDPLTELANRRRFTDELARVARRGRPGDYLGVLFCDRDGFKEVNDRYGHEAGNELLVAVAARLRACMRAGDLVARIGGDEFTVMLARLESIAPATTIAARICDLLSDPYVIGRQEIHISTSVGVAPGSADLVAGTDGRGRKNL